MCSRTCEISTCSTTLTPLTIPTGTISEDTNLAECQKCPAGSHCYADENGQYKVVCSRIYISVKIPLLDHDNRNAKCGEN